MNHNPANADGIGGVSHTPRGVAEQGAADAPALKRAVYGKARKDGHRNRIRHVPFESADGALHDNGTRGQRIVADHAIPFTSYKGA